jgi:LysR family hydrogen peroxide-inducible transcriptional activator
MDLRQLNALLAVADHGSFTAAADALNTVQSNVSAHVARLERRSASSWWTVPPAI